MDIDPQKEAEFLRIYGIQPKGGVAPDKEAMFKEIYGIKDAPEDVSQLLQGENKGSGRAALQGFNATVPFGERIVAGLGAAAAAPFVDESIGSLYNQARANQKATADANPNAYLAGTVGGIAATLPVGLVKSVASTPVLGGAANALSKAASATGNYVGGASSLAGRAVRSATVAAPTSAIYSYGASENDLDTEKAMGDAARGFGYGTAFGVALPVLGAGAGALIASGADAVASRMARKSGEVIGKNSDPALQKIYTRLVADYGQDEAQKIINSYASSKGKSLVEAGGARTANLAEGAAQYPSGGAAASEFFDDAVQRAPEKLKTALNKNISQSSNYYDTADAIVDEGRAKVAPLYNEAYKANQQVNSPIINRILETPEGKSALSEAARNMQNEMALLSKPDPELTALAREAGMQATGQGVGSGLKLRTLDYIKRSMDDTIRTARRAGDDGQVRRITQLKNGLLNEMDANDVTGLYAKARKESGDYLSANDALEQGTRFLKDDSQLIARNYGVMGAAEKKAYKAGVIKVMRENMENAIDGSNVSRVFNKPATREKLKAILSPREYKNLMNNAMATDKIYKLRNQIVGNSRTAGRQIAAEEFNDDTARLVGDLATKGATRVAIDKAVGTIARQFDGLSDRSAGEVAKILYETDPQKKYKIVKDLSNLSKQISPRGTDAAKKLQAFYALSDAVFLRKNSSLPYVTLPQGQTLYAQP